MGKMNFFENIDCIIYYTFLVRMCHISCYNFGDKKLKRYKNLNKNELISSSSNIEKGELKYSNPFLALTIAIFDGSYWSQFAFA